MLTRIILIGAAAALLTSPAIADGKKKEKDPAKKLVCVEMEPTGSHIPDRVCKTQAEWDQEKANADADMDRLGRRVNTPGSMLSTGQTPAGGSGPG